MRVEATAKGFFDSEVRNYNEDNNKGDQFTIKPRSDEFIIKNRLEKSNKKVTSSERYADVEMQFSSKWMKKVAETVENSDD